MWAKTDRSPHAWSTGGGCKPTQLPLKLDGHGPLPLGIPEQAPPAIPIISEEDTAIKHKLLMFSHPWELTHPAAATAKFSGHLEDTFELITASQGPVNRSNLCRLPAGLCFC